MKRRWETRKVKKRKEDKDLVLKTCRSIGKHIPHSTSYLLVFFSGQAYFQEQLYNSTLLGCGECYTQLIPLCLGHVT